MISSFRSRVAARSTMAMAASLLAVAATEAPAEPLREQRDRLYLSAEVNGVAVEALLDSGAELSVADTAFAREAHIVGGAEVAMRGT